MRALDPRISLRGAGL